LTGIECPLCGATNTTLLEKINAADVAEIFRKSFDYDLSVEYGEVEKLSFCHCLNCDLRFFHPMITGSEAFYDVLKPNEGCYCEDKSEFEYAKQYIGGSDAVLEIGCGKGAFAKKISPRHYLGLEITQKAVQMARDDGINAEKETIQSHASHSSGKYDVVCAFHVLEHVAEVHSFIKSSVACLKSGGLLIYSTPSADSFVSLLTNPLLNIPPHHVTWWSDKCLNYVAEGFGLSVVDLEHEVLADRNRRMYARLIVLESLKSLAGIKPSLINRSLKYRIVSKIANMGARLLEKGLNDRRVLPWGHAVTAVYRK